MASAIWLGVKLPSCFNAASRIDRVVCCMIFSSIIFSNDERAETAVKLPGIVPIFSVVFGNTAVSLEIRLVERLLDVYHSMHSDDGMLFLRCYTMFDIGQK